MQGEVFFYMILTNDEWTIIPPPDDYPMKRRGGFRSKDIVLLEDRTVLIVDEYELYYYQPGFEKNKTLSLYNLPNRYPE